MTLNIAAHGFGAANPMQSPDAEILDPSWIWKSIIITCQLYRYQCIYARIRYNPRSRGIISAHFSPTITIVA